MVDTSIKNLQKFV